MEIDLMKGVIEKKQAELTDVKSTIGKKDEELQTLKNTIAMANSFEYEAQTLRDQLETFKIECGDLHESKETLQMQLRSIQESHTDVRSYADSRYKQSAIIEMKLREKNRSLTRSLAELSSKYKKLEELNDKLRTYSKELFQQLKFSEELRSEQIARSRQSEYLTLSENDQLKQQLQKHESLTEELTDSLQVSAFRGDSLHRRLGEAIDSSFHAQKHVEDIIEKVEWDNHHLRSSSRKLQREKDHLALQLNLTQKAVDVLTKRHEYFGSSLQPQVQFNPGATLALGSFASTPDPLPSTLTIDPDSNTPHPSSSPLPPSSPDSSIHSHQSLSSSHSQLSHQSSHSHHSLQSLHSTHSHRSTSSQQQRDSNGEISSLSTSHKSVLTTLQPFGTNRPTPRPTSSNISDTIPSSLQSTSSPHELMKPISIESSSSSSPPLHPPYHFTDSISSSLDPLPSSNNPITFSASSPSPPAPPLPIDLAYVVSHSLVEEIDRGRQSLLERYCTLLTSFMEREAAWKREQLEHLQKTGREGMRPSSSASSLPILDTPLSSKSQLPPLSPSASSSSSSSSSSSKSSKAFSFSKQATTPFHLTHVNLSSICLNSQDVKQIIVSIRNLSKHSLYFHSIDLSCNRLTDESIDHLAAWLSSLSPDESTYRVRENSPLDILLGSNQISRAGITRLNTILRTTLYNENCLIVLDKNCSLLTILSSKLEYRTTGPPSRKNTTIFRLKFS